MRSKQTEVCPLAFLLIFGLFGSVYKECGYCGVFFVVSNELKAGFPAIVFAATDQADHKKQKCQDKKGKE